jgi:hypothetical protein
VVVRQVICECPLGLGDEGHQLSLEYDLSSYGQTIHSTIVYVGFGRGVYDAFLSEVFIREGMSHSEKVADATALARIIDGRIQAQTASSTFATRS